MFNHNRDRDINYIKTRKDHCCYGMGLGIIVLDDAYPGFPGDVRNASAFPYPIQRVIDLPVFSWGTLLDYAYSVVVHRDYYGHL